LAVSWYHRGGSRRKTTGGSIQKDLMVRNCLYKKKVKITPWQHFMKDFGGSEDECDFLWISSEGLLIILKSIKLF